MVEYLFSMEFLHRMPNALLVLGRFNYLNEFIVQILMGYSDNDSIYDNNRPKQKLPTLRPTKHTLHIFPYGQPTVQK